MRKFFQSVRKKSLLDNKPVVGVEVGVWMGLNAFENLMLNPYMTLHLVDCYERGLSDVAKDAANYILAPFHERIIWHYKTSVEAAKDFLDGSLDFVYIDAAHDYISVKQDIEAWRPKIKSGGVLGGHDFYDVKQMPVKSRKHNGVSAAVHNTLLPGEKFHYSVVAGDWWLTV